MFSHISAVVPGNELELGYTIVFVLGTTDQINACRAIMPLYQSEGVIFYEDVQYIKKTRYHTEIQVMNNLHVRLTLI